MSTGIESAPLQSSVLHIAGWYPSPWNEVEGNFIQSHISHYLQVAKGNAIVVQVRTDPGHRIRFRTSVLAGGVRGYYILTRLVPGRLTEAMSTLLLLVALVRNRAWRYDVLHFHIAYPLLIHLRMWRWLFRKPILISEHWSAYHFNFHLAHDAKALARLRRPFLYGIPILAVSKALLDDIRRFAGRPDVPGRVIPNVVPLHGARRTGNAVPVLFAVNRWVEIKDPEPMLAGLVRAAEKGLRFELVIGGYGALLESMKLLVERSRLADRTQFVGTMSKLEIAEQLGRSDGYLFSSQYETFSVACAEALGAGVPLIGPYIPAISEYAGSEEWEVVESRDGAAWTEAVERFLRRLENGQFDRQAIAQRAGSRFAPELIRAAYRSVLAGLGEDDRKFNEGAGQ